ncbi:MAG: Monooxygenase, binding [Herminiimonas sp.]|nr:Monooxygenase, binding [Herminiimonas sp.]
MTSTINTRCCVVGGGPAGMMTGLLLARAGVEVVVLEKHVDFLRDFRGDTVHPSTLQVMDELGLLDALLARPHDKAVRLSVVVGGEPFSIADFSRLNERCGFIAMMPQWEFLDFLRDVATNFPTFRLLMQAKATGLIPEAGRIGGVLVETANGPLRIESDLVISADGRHSVVRELAQMKVREFGAPIDVLWMRLPFEAGDPTESMGRLETGRFMAMINRGTYWQCAFVIPKGGIEQLQARGLDAFRRAVAEVAPLLASRTASLKSWDDIKLLSVAVDRLEKWDRPGLLCIGDAAHAMSPIGGVGINLAVQDAVATANLLAAALADAGTAREAIDALLPSVQARRLFPARVTQAVQVAIQNRLLVPVLQGDQNRRLKAPWPVRMLDRWPVLRVIPAYAVGIGARPEHVQTEVVSATSAAAPL